MPYDILAVFPDADYLGLYTAYRSRWLFGSVRERAWAVANIVELPSSGDERIKADLLEIAKLVTTGRYDVQSPDGEVSDGDDSDDADSWPSNLRLNLGKKLLESIIVFRATSLTGTASMYFVSNSHRLGLAEMTLDFDRKLSYYGGIATCSESDENWACSGKGCLACSLAETRSYKHYCQEQLEASIRAKGLMPARAFLQMTRASAIALIVSITPLPTELAMFAVDCIYPDIDAPIDPSEVDEIDNILEEQYDRNRVIGEYRADISCLRMEISSGRGPAARLYKMLHAITDSGTIEKIRAMPGMSEIEIVKYAHSILGDMHDTIRNEFRDAPCPSKSCVYSGRADAPRDDY